MLKVILLISVLMLTACDMTDRAPEVKPASSFAVKRFEGVVCVTDPQYRYHCFADTGAR